MTPKIKSSDTDTLLTLAELPLAPDNQSNEGKAFMAFAMTEHQKNESQIYSFLRCCALEQFRAPEILQSLFNGGFNDIRYMGTAVDPHTAGLVVLQTWISTSAEWAELKAEMLPVFSAWVQSCIEAVALKAEQAEILGRAQRLLVAKEAEAKLALEQDPEVAKARAAVDAIIASRILNP